MCTCVHHRNFCPICENFRGEIGKEQTHFRYACKFYLMGLMFPQKIYILMSFTLVSSWTWCCGESTTWQIAFLEGTSGPSSKFKKNVIATSVNRRYSYSKSIIAPQHALKTADSSTNLTLWLLGNWHIVTHFLATSLHLCVTLTQNCWSAAPEQFICLYCTLALYCLVFWF
jgi:hypothetical protein